MKVGKVKLIGLLAGLLLTALIGGCAKHPLTNASVTSVETDGHGKISMGDTAYIHYICPCLKTYRAQKEIQISGLPAIPAQSIWVARFNNAKTGETYLVNDNYHLQLALVMRNGTINPARAVAQFAGMKKSRTWPLSSPSDSTALKPDGYSFNSPSWKLQYLGLDKENNKVLRFSIADISGSETIGQVEYNHNLANGNSFVIKGVKFEVLEKGNDGTLAYSYSANE